MRDKVLNRQLFFGFVLGLVIVTGALLLSVDYAWDHCTRDLSSIDCRRYGIASVVAFVVSVVLGLVLFTLDSNDTGK